MKQDYDVIIIGGGLLGCATAYQLAKRKAGKVLLLDANEIASQLRPCSLPVDTGAYQTGFDGNGAGNV